MSNQYGHPSASSAFSWAKICSCSIPAIGCADGQVGKRQVHAFHESRTPVGSDWSDNMVLEEGFMENMADCGKAICDYFGKHIVFLNVARPAHSSRSDRGYCPESPLTAAAFSQFVSASPPSGLSIFLGRRSPPRASGSCVRAPARASPPRAGSRTPSASPWASA